MIVIYNDQDYFSFFYLYVREDFFSLVEIIWGRVTGARTIKSAHVPYVA
jgi:hypothetical protein